MAAFVDGTLARDEIAEVAAHLRDCADCRLIVSETSRFEREEEAASRPARMHWLAIAASIVFAAVIGLIAIAIHRQKASVDHLIAAAPRSHRTVEARLSGFPWARLQAPARGEAKSDPSDLKLAGAAGDVLEATTNRKDTAAARARGVAYLITGARAESIAALERAAQTSKDAHAWNDLAVARYTAATVDERPSQLPEGLADVDRALRLDPSFAEARFNRALILERLGILEPARKAWSDYLLLDAKGDWSAEARAHLQKLQSSSRRYDAKALDAQPAVQLVRAFPEEARRNGEAALLANWGDAVVANDEPRAATTLTRARDVGTALAQFNGEHLLEDAVAAIDRAGGGTQTTLVDAHRLYRTARMTYNARHVHDAEAQFRDAAGRFARGNSPMAAVAQYYAASAAFDQQRTREAHDELQRLLAATDANRYRALAAQIHWELAVCANGEGDWGTAVRESDAAATIFRALGEGGDAAIADSVGSMALELIGADDLAWERRIRAMSQFSANGAQQKLAALLHTASGTLASRDRIAAAAAMLELAQEVAPPEPAQRARTDADRARIAAREGDVELARNTLLSARSAATGIKDAALHEIAGAQIDLAEASVASLDRSIAFFTQHDMRVDLAEAYLQRGRARRASGKADAALDDYSRALAEIETQRAALRDPASRLRFLDVAAGVLEESVELRIARGDAAGAFAITDRAHRMLDGGGPGPPLALPSDVAVIEYAVLHNAVVTFAVTQKGVVAQRVAVDRGELAARVAAFAERIRRRAPIAEVNDDAVSLYALLVEPLEAQIAGVRELVIVPDRDLHELPFAALRNRTQYLAERFVLEIAPSAAWHAEASAPLTPALVVADPAAPPYPHLAASRDEAAHIAALHGATTLLGDAATRLAFTAAAERSALIHYAGHANSDAATSYAALLLARSGDDPGLLAANDIAAMHLGAHPLVVLAACGTFRGETLHVAGMSSLARAFLLAGARGVVGTLWEIDDDVSAALFLRLHEHVRDGALPASALRQAQLKLLQSSDVRLAHPATWAPVVFVRSQPER